MRFRVPEGATEDDLQQMERAIVVIGPITLAARFAFVDPIEGTEQSALTLEQACGNPMAVPPTEAGLAQALVDIRSVRDQLRAAMEATIAEARARLMRSASDEQASNASGSVGIEAMPFNDAR